MPLRPLIRPGFAEALRARYPFVQRRLASSQRTVTRATTGWPATGPAHPAQRTQRRHGPRPWDFDVASTILYHDNGVVAVNKPAGIVTQAYTKMGETDKRKVKEDVFTQYTKRIARCLNHSGNVYPVHRLDTDTTGALLLGLTDARTRDLSAQFRNRTVKKTYLALVHGGVDAFPAISGEIRAPIYLRDNMPVHHDRANSKCEVKEAATDWELLGSSPVAPLSLVRLGLLTGYKHQLRVHLAHRLNAPVLNDPIYELQSGSPEVARVVTHDMRRMFLHSADIAIHRYRESGPTKGKRYELRVCAPVPSDLLQVCRQAQIEIPKRYVVGGTFADGVDVQHEPSDLEASEQRPLHMA
ncbi:pseudouridine synthase [Schizophyllum amplum]|uniref:Pseudouridine synthase n=1 Tax=Schizophyllum amplum TaxID=97359 RepID=A0A550CNI6_9AGAR|nr:pseudouridine synthase [Auriculariopsis ampla]